MDAHLYSWQIILNPNALFQRSSQFWKDIENKLREVQITYHPHVTPTVAEAKDLIRSLCKKGERHFILVGGDGTLNIFVNAVMEAQVDCSEIYAALIPIGTGNDWSRTLGYSRNYLDAIDALLKGSFFDHDLGLVETVINGEVIDTRYFVNIAGFGFDGSVISNASKTTTKFFHKQLYLFNLLRTLLAYKSRTVTIKSNDFSVTKKMFTIAVGIGQYNGNGMRQCPGAEPNDGLFDVVIIEKVSILKVLLNIKNLFSGTHVDKLKEVSMYQTEYLEINAEPFLLGEVEGEMLTAGNYRIRCLYPAFNLMCVE